MILLFEYDLLSNLEKKVIDDAETRLEIKKKNKKEKKKKEKIIFHTGHSIFTLEARLFHRSISINYRH